MFRTTAQRIVDTLQARASGLLPADYDEQLAADVDAMNARYNELKKRWASVRRTGLPKSNLLSAFWPHSLIDWRPSSPKQTACSLDVAVAPLLGPAGKERLHEGPDLKGKVLRRNR